MRLTKCPASAARSRTIVFLLAAILIVGLSLALGQVWVKKDYKEWGAKDCEKVLTNSPWAKTQKYYGSGLGSAGEGGQAYTQFIAQLYSALPVRHAMVRQQLIAAKYDSLPAEKKQEIDKSAEKVLAADYSDKVVLKVLYETNLSAAMLDLVRSWDSQTIANFQNTAFLIGSKGAKVAAVGYQPVGDQYFLLTFPRVTSDGKPILSVEDKNLIVQFEYKPVRGMGDGKAQFEFKVKDMIYAGQIAY